MTHLPTDAWKRKIHIEPAVAKIMEQTKQIDLEKWKQEAQANDQGD